MFQKKKKYGKESSLNNGNFSEQVELKYSPPLESTQESLYETHVTHQQTPFAGVGLLAPLPFELMSSGWCPLLQRHSMRICTLKYIVHEHSIPTEPSSVKIAFSESQ